MVKCPICNEIHDQCPYNCISKAKEDRSKIVPMFEYLISYFPEDYKRAVMGNND